uniref:Carboxypeptidase n=1 Tax=Salix viminalis TaxID=40686 RepID=A0A6N2KGB7_SALVM
MAPPFRDNRVTEHINEVSKLRFFAEQKPLRRVFSFLYVIVACLLEISVYIINFKRSIIVFFSKYRQGQRGDGVALGDSWISPEDFVKQLAEGEYEDATSSWSELEHVVLSNSNNVDFYNFLLDYVNDPIGSSGRKQQTPFSSSKVDELLAKGINVTIYNGQLDLIICSTKGAEAWDGLQNFLSLDRSSLSCKSDSTTTKGFTSSYKNLFFYWILGAGHFVPAEQPCISLQMVGNSVAVLLLSPMASYLITEFNG